jgi:hypothetical protein
MEQANIPPMFTQCRDCKQFVSFDQLVKAPKNNGKRKGVFFVGRTTLCKPCKNARGFEYELKRTEVRREKAKIAKEQKLLSKTNHIENVDRVPENFIGDQHNQMDVGKRLTKMVRDFRVGEIPQVVVEERRRRRNMSAPNREVRE